jgi:hypothetical protein
MNGGTSESGRNRLLVVPIASADVLLEWMHKTAWPGDVVTKIAPIIEQLETFAPRSSSSST